MSHRLKLVIAYFGQPFHGWQRQRDQRSVQGEVEQALERFTGGRPLTIHGAGRTDSGVHAVGQVAHVDLPSPVPADALKRALNKSLPPEIRVRRAVEVGPTFHARMSALGKRYVYRARWWASDLPWLNFRVATIKKIERPDALIAASRLFIGRHDWASFTVPNPKRDQTFRRLYRVDLRWGPAGLDVACVGDGFLRYQVRRMVGLLLEIGSGKRDPGEVSALLDDPQPGTHIKTAPAAGLCLEKVYYRNAPALKFTRPECPK